MEGESVEFAMEISQGGEMGRISRVENKIKIGFRGEF